MVSNILKLHTLHIGIGWSFFRWFDNSGYYVCTCLLQITIRLIICGPLKTWDTYAWHRLSDLTAFHLSSVSINIQQDLAFQIVSIQKEDQICKNQMFLTNKKAYRVSKRDRDRSILQYSAALWDKKMACYLTIQYKSWELTELKNYFLVKLTSVFRNVALIFVAFV